MGTLGHDAVAFVQEILSGENPATRNVVGYVIGSVADHFSVGANLSEALGLIEAGDWKAVEGFLVNGQTMTRAVKFSKKPVVVAPFGMCLGGGTELSMHAAACESHIELAMGLVETGVGLIPGGGGCKEMTLRALSVQEVPRTYMRPDSVESQHRLLSVFETLAKAKVSGSALEAKRLQLLRASDGITMNRRYLLASAKRRALDFASTGYRAPTPLRDIPAPGKPALAHLQLNIHLLREGEFISDHDAFIARKLAGVLCGGSVVAGTLVSEEDLLSLERDAFLSLCGEKRTQDRIAFTLKTGKPLRN
jgi:3-hydroxyacyl-CoA dehydrogenase